MREAKVTGWPAVVTVLLILLGLTDVVERMIEAIL